MTIIISSCNKLKTAVDWSGIKFDQWWKLPVEEIRNQKLSSHHSLISLADIVEIEHQADGHDLISIYPGDNLFHGLGAHLKRGKVVINGNGGHKIGYQLAGGTIEVLGDTLDYTGQGMTKGTIIVRGNCGDQLAAPLPGDKAGMRGGEIHIDGDAGLFAGHRMRRGLITVKKSAAAGLASEMLAGTIVVGNTNFLQLGTGIKRGTIVALRPTDKLMLSGFSYACEYQPVWWRIYAKHLIQQQLFTHADNLFDLKFQRYTGDMLELNKAEILLVA